MKQLLYVAGMLHVCFSDFSFQSLCVCGVGKKLPAVLYVVYWDWGKKAKTTT